MVNNSKNSGINDNKSSVRPEQGFRCLTRNSVLEIKLPESYDLCKGSRISHDSKVLLFNEALFVIPGVPLSMHLDKCPGMQPLCC